MRECLPLDSTILKLVHQLFIVELEIMYRFNLGQPKSVAP